MIFVIRPRDTDYDDVESASREADRSGDAYVLVQYQEDYESKPRLIQYPFFTLSDDPNPGLPVYEVLQLLLDTKISRDIQ